MRFERVTNIAHKMYESALKLYKISFPYYERRESVSQAEILSDEEYHFNLIYDRDVFVGLMLYWETGDFIYVEHFCILPEMRNRKYGQRALKLLVQQGKKVVLEIDPPIDTVSTSRKGFYERNGFAENPFPHIPPPYHKGDGGHNMGIMSYPAKITQTEYDHFNHYLAHHVMVNVFNEA